MGKIGSNNINRKLKALANEGRAFPLEHYKGIKGHQAKRDFALKMELDPELCWLQALETEAVKIADSQKVSHGPCYLWDVARLNGCAYDPSNVQLMKFLKSLVSECETEISPDAERQRNGDLLYYYVKKIEKTIGNTHSQGCKN